MESQFIEVRDGNKYDECEQCKRQIKIRICCFMRLIFLLFIICVLVFIPILFFENMINKEFNEKLIRISDFVAKEISKGNNNDLPYELSKYLNNQNVINFEANNQIGGTCYANAIAASFYFAQSRIIGRKSPSFMEILDYIQNKYGYDGGKMFSIAETESAKYKIKVSMLKELSLWDKFINWIGKPFGRKESLSLEAKVKEAIKNGGQVLVAFALTTNQWCNFFEFFYVTNKKGILDSSTLNKKCTYTYPKESAHGVLLTKVTDDYFEFLNSWGKDFGDNGRFKLKSFDTFKIVDYMEVYNSKELLSETEKNMWNYYIFYFQNLYKKMNSNQVNSLDVAKELEQIECPICGESFSFSEIEGDFTKAKCPECNRIFEPKDDNAVKLYVRYITGSENKYSPFIKKYLKLRKIIKKYILK